MRSAAEDTTSELRPARNVESAARLAAASERAGGLRKAPTMGYTCLSIREADACTVVRIRGGLDAASVASVADLLGGLTARTPHMVLDLGVVQFIDCCALGVLLGVRSQARSAGGDLVLAAPQRQVLRMLTLTGMIDVFTVRPSLEEGTAIESTEPREESASGPLQVG